MFWNYLRVALRVQLKQKFYTLINIGGLAIGIASGIIIALYVIHETSYDKHIPNGENIFRVDHEIKFGANHIKMPQVSAGFGPLLSTYPEVQSWVRVGRISTDVQSSPEIPAIKENDLFWVDSAFFKVFDIALSNGNQANALSQPASIVINRSVAEKYFPGKNALGQSLTLKQLNRDLKVTGVFEDFPLNSHFHPRFLLSMDTNDDANSSSLIGGRNYSTYMKLTDPLSAIGIQQKFVKLVDQFVAPQMAKVIGGDFTIEKFRASGEKWEYTLTPLRDIHLHSNLTGELEANGNIGYLFLLIGIGVLILGIACVNFVNLSTARSAGRSKEIGVRKVMGSLRTHLIRQFLVEAIVITFCALLISLLFAQLALPGFNELTSQQLELPFGEPVFYILLVLAGFVVGGLAGIYPSFFLSAFKPASVLKGQLGSSRTGVIRNSLVVFQFVITIFLLVGTLAIRKQLAYMHGRDPGFNKNQMLIVHEGPALGSSIDEFKRQLLQNTFVKAGTISGYLPVANSWGGGDTFRPEGAQLDMNEMLRLNTWSVDEDYIQTMGLKVIAGHDFDPRRTSDSSGVILNEAAVRRLGVPDPLGKKLFQIVGRNPDGTPDSKNVKAWTIIGVVKDFNFETMKNEIEPVGFFLRRSTGFISVRFDAAHTDEVVAAAKSSWEKLNSEVPFTYSFLDEDFNRMYNSETRLGKIFGSFSGLAIFIACLGIFALTAFTAEQRTKEIGIRKVLGASVSTIVVLLSKNFGKLILISFLIAAPLSWYSVQWWLEGYSYKTNVGISVYMIAGLAAAVLAWVTMSFQSIKAALSDPVKSLRSE